MFRKFDSPSDQETVDRILSGEAELFSQLLDKYEPLVASVLSRLAPKDHLQDLAQEVFLALFDSLRDVNAKDGLHGFLKTLCVRRAHDFWRKSANREMPLSQLTEDEYTWLDGRDTAWTSAGVEDLANQVEQLDFIEKMLASFSATDRLLVILVWLEENTVAEAAKQLGISLANAKIRMFRCRHRLKSMLGRTLEV